MGVRETDPLTQLSLPPGFRFYPTDEELLVQYLCKKVAGHHFSLQIIGEIDLYKFDPWVLPSKAIFGEKEWYFFSPRDRKYPNGSRPNRVAGSGYWKATGTDKVITTEGRKVGIKKALVFYVGKAPKGTKTNWIMHEYRLLETTRRNGSSKLDDWVLCRIYKKNSGAHKPVSSISSKEHSQNGSSSSSSSHLDDVLDSLPVIDERYLSVPKPEEKINITRLDSGNIDWAALAGLNLVSELSQAQPMTQGMIGYTSAGDDLYVPSLTQQLGHVDPKVEEEVQSGIRRQRVENSGFFPHNSSVLTQGYPNSLDPYGLRYSAQPGTVFGFRH